MLQFGCVSHGQSGVTSPPPLLCVWSWYKASQIPIPRCAGGRWPLTVRPPPETSRLFLIRTKRHHGFPSEERRLCGTHENIFGTSFLLSLSLYNEYSHTQFDFLWLQVFFFLLERKHRVMRLWRLFQSRLLVATVKVLSAFYTHMYTHTHTHTPAITPLITSEKISKVCSGC